MLGRDRDRFVEIAGEDQVVAAEELAGFGERAVGDEASPFADADAGGGRDGMQRRRADVLAAGVELVCEFRRFLLSGSQGGGAGFVPGLLVVVAEEHVARSGSFRLGRRGPKLSGGRPRDGSPVGLQRSLSSRRGDDWQRRWRRRGSVRR